MSRSRTGRTSASLGAKRERSSQITGRQLCVDCGVFVCPDSSPGPCTAPRSGRGLRTAAPLGRARGTGCSPRLSAFSCLRSRCLPLLVSRPNPAGCSSAPKRSPWRATRPPTPIPTRSPTGTCSRASTSLRSTTRRPLANGSRSAKVSSPKARPRRSPQRSNPRPRSTQTQNATRSARKTKRPAR